MQLPEIDICLCASLDAKVFLYGYNNGENMYYWNLVIKHNSDAGFSQKTSMAIEAPFNLSELGTRLIQQDPEKE